MGMSRSVLVLLSLFIVLVIAIIIVGTFVLTDTSKVANSNSVMVINGSSSVDDTSSIISSKFSGEHKQDGEVVVIRRDGSYYIADEGEFYISGNGLQIDAQSKDSIVVYELVKR